MSKILLRNYQCRSGGIGRRKGLKIPWAFGPCGFDSRLRHQRYPFVQMFLDKLDLSAIISDGRQQLRVVDCSVRNFVAGWSSW
jgi:hypothetical protein